MAETNEGKFVMVPVSLIADYRLNDAEFRYLVSLRKWAWGECFECWPQNVDIAEAAGFLDPVKVLAAREERKRSRKEKGKGSKGSPSLSKVKVVGRTLEKKGRIKRVIVTGADGRKKRERIIIDRALWNGLESNGGSAKSDGGVVPNQTAPQPETQPPPILESNGGSLESHPKSDEFKDPSHETNGKKTQSHQTNGAHPSPSEITLSPESANAHPSEDRKASPGWQVGDVPTQVANGLKALMDERDNRRRHDLVGELAEVMALALDDMHSKSNYCKVLWFTVTGKYNPAHILARFTAAIAAYDTGGRPGRDLEPIDNRASWFFIAVDAQAANIAENAVKDELQQRYEANGTAHHGTPPGQEDWPQVLPPDDPCKEFRRKLEKLAEEAPRLPHRKASEQVNILARWLMLRAPGRGNPKFYGRGLWSVVRKEKTAEAELEAWREQIEAERLRSSGQPFDPTDPTEEDQPAEASARAEAVAKARNRAIGCDSEPEGEREEDYDDVPF